MADVIKIDITVPNEVSASDEALLQEIRDRYRYYDDRWREIRDERNIDMRYISGDPWEPEDRLARKDAGRPCISHDELGQYINACVNSARMNKKGIKVEPRGENSNEKTAEFRQNHIRAIEYDNRAPSVYLTAFQSMVEGSYAFFRIGRKYVSNDIDSNDSSIFNQKITIKSIPNPNSVLFDPDCKEPDWSDGQACFVVEPMPKQEFKRRFPNAQITDFAPEMYRVAKDWLHDDMVLVAEYWRIEKVSRMKYWLGSGEVVDELPKGVKAAKSRKVVRNKVIQYETNGVEILSRTEQPGEHLGIVPMIGLQRYIDEGGMAVRKIFSLVRLARDPQMSLAYLNSLEMEEAGLTPKTPLMGYVGQFETDRDAIENSTKIPTAFLQFDPIVDGAPGTVLPLPQRVPFTPNFQQYELVKDSCRRAVQAAMGITPLPTAAQRDNQKSGVALDKISQQQEIGSFHFIDSYDMAISLAGRIIESWIPVTYDTERTEALRKPDDSYQMARLNTEEPYPDPKTGQMVHYKVEEDMEHATTVSSGPSYMSQQEAAADFLDLLVQRLPNLPVAPPQAAKLLALAIQMRQLGPKGDEMAEIISPTDQGQAAQAQQQIAMAQQQLQQQGMLLEEFKAELQKLQLEKQGRVVDNEYRMAIAKMQEENKLAIAEVNTKSQALSERLEFVNDLAHKFLDQAHDVGLQAQDQSHAQDLAQAQQMHEQQQAEQAAQQQQQQPQPGQPQV